MILIYRITCLARNIIEISMKILSSAANARADVPKETVRLRICQILWDGLMALGALRRALILRSRSLFYFSRLV